MRGEANMEPVRVNEHLKEKLNEPYFKELYELEEQKLKIVKRIINYRIKNNISQKQLAKRIGVTQQHISKIESGEFSSISTLEKVLLFIGYTVKMQAVPISDNIRHKIDQLIQSRKRPQLA
jgi:DNA-binding XRE family transcriptional regulator